MSGESGAEAPQIKKIRKKKHHGGGHHGGAWKVAYADFITTMMALFLLLWLLAASDQSTKNIIAMYFKDPGIFDNAQGANIMSGQGSSKKAQAVPISEVVGPGRAGQGGSENQLTMQDVERALRRALASVGPRIRYEQSVLFTPTSDGLLLQIVDDGKDPLFLPGDTKFTNRANEIVEQMGSILALLPDFELEVGGHTDKKGFPPGSLYTNWDLSLDRAQQATKVLLASGVPVQRIKAIAGFADTKLLDPDAPYGARNRRLSILLRRITPDQSTPAYHAGPGAPPVAPPGTSEEESSPSGEGSPEASPAEDGMH